MVKARLRGLGGVVDEDPLAGYVTMVRFMGTDTPPRLSRPPAGRHRSPLRVARRAAGDCYPIEEA